jgi:uncharacterized membrane protein YfcA
LVLLFVAGSEFTGLARRMRFHGAVAWVAGAISGLLGGLWGARILTWIPESRFRAIVATILAILGATMLAGGAR